MKKKLLVFVGTYTKPIRFGTGQILEGKGKGIYCYELDMKTGALEQIAESQGIDNPSYLTLDAAQKHLYAVNELKEFDGKAQGGVSAFSINSDYTLTFQNQFGTGGTDPCHVVMNDENTHVYISNFMSGSVAVFPIEKDGSLAPMSDFIQHEGSSVNPKRQTGPHAHSLIFDKANKRAFVPDLGIDKMMIYQTDFETSKLIPGEIPYYKTFPGAGPRHCEFTDDGTVSFLINELASSISALAYDAATGGFTLLHTVPTIIDKDFTADNICADVHLSPDGKFLYGSNRGHHSIVVYAYDHAARTLTYVENISCGGETPRNFCIDPTGEYALVANQDTDNIVTFKIDKKTGRLTKLSEVFAPTPVCIKPYWF